MLDLTPIEERLAMRTAFLAVQDDEEGPSALEQVTLLDYHKLIAEVKRLREEVEKEQRDWGVEADARTMREEQIEAIARELGSDAEWTSACDLGWHTRDLAGAVAGERDRLKDLLDEATATIRVAADCAGSKKTGANLIKIAASLEQRGGLTDTDAQ